MELEHAELIGGRGCPACAQGTDKYLSDLELHVLDNCSHWVQQDKCALLPCCASTSLNRLAMGPGMSRICLAAHGMSMRCHDSACCAKGAVLVPFFAVPSQSSGTWIYNWL